MRHRPAAGPLAATLAAALLAAAALAAGGAAAQERVAFDSRDGDLTRGAPTRIDGLLWRPAGDGPFPAIVLMHGCGGLWARGNWPTPRHREWAERFAAAGYVVLHVDSFRPRGFEEVCRQPPPNVRPGFERARDAHAALAFLQARPDVDPARVGLMGWSHGGSTTLWATRAGSPARPPGAAPDFAAAIAFYPGCAAPLAWRGGWTPRVPLLVLIGDADDWTPSAPCIELAAREAATGAPIEFVLYPGAPHGFDAPNQPQQTLRGLNTPSGRATIGTDPAARADSIRRATTWFAERLRP